MEENTWGCWQILLLDDGPLIKYEAIRTNRNLELTMTTPVAATNINITTERTALLRAYNACTRITRRPVEFPEYHSCISYKEHLTYLRQVSGWQPIYTDDTSATNGIWGEHKLRVEARPRPTSAYFYNYISVVV